MPTRPCWVEISARAFENNYRFLTAHAPPQSELLAIVKADAYGHSLALCAPAAVRAGARWVGVTSVEEAITARRLCPHARILVMGGIFPGQGGALHAQGLTPVVWTPAQVEEMDRAASAANAPTASVPIHLEIDTGMSRQGVAPAELGSLLPCFGPRSPLRVEAITTHLYASDETNGMATACQLKHLEDALGRLPSSPTTEYLTVGASAALLGNDGPSIAALARRSGLKLILRPGLALYGVVPRFEPPFGANEEPPALAAAREHLQPVLAWKTRVVSVRDLPTGADIGYNGTFVATEPMRVALIAAGYADGLDRRLGNRFSLLVRGERAPLVGRISMDQSVLDVTEIPGVEAGDEVVILGTQGGETITAYDHADAVGTIPWEVFTRIGPRVARIEV
ncbi:MAG TPA: alanine racemase [Candidatus Sulfopaludibacter sp.]|nr:alanine racemase [Candidatus Sulfopaludibacter sp.]